MQNTALKGSGKLSRLLGLFFGNLGRWVWTRPC
jgi:hypothetical protein